jgi:hypothetical protein
MSMRNVRLAVVPLALAVAGCGSVIGSAIDQAASRTGQGIGDAVGKRAGAAAGARIGARIDVWTPFITQMYVNYLFSMAFNAGTYTFETKEYAAGDWTRWQVPESAEDGSRPATMERAFLSTTAEGNEWWRVKWVAYHRDNGTESADTITLEGLFSADKSQLVRLRGKMPKDTEGKEMPVQEGTYGYARPIPLTEESVRGATVGVENVRVPAGSFQARRVRYGDMGGGTLEWWLVDNVPGGMVKYLRKAPGERSEDGPDAANWTLELVAHGRGARSELGSN